MNGLVVTAGTTSTSTGQSGYYQFEVVPRRTEEKGLAAAIRDVRVEVPSETESHSVEGVSSLPSPRPQPDTQQGQGLIAELVGWVDEVDGEDVRVVFDNDGNEVEAIFDWEHLKGSGIKGLGDRFLYRIVDRDGLTTFEIEKLSEQDNPHLKRSREIFEELARDIET